MKKIFNILILFFFMSVLIFKYETSAQTGWYQQNSGTSENLNGVSLVDKNTAVAVGDNGTILKTSDGGLNWIILSAGITQDLYSVSFIDALTGIVVGDSGTILRTTDGGINWIDQSYGSCHLYGVSSIDANTATVVGYHGIIGYIIRTTDGGNSWVSQGNLIYPPGHALRGVSFTSSDNGIVVGYSNYKPDIYRIAMSTNDGGTSWSEQTFEQFQNLYGVCCIDTNTGTAVGTNGAILKTIDGGLNWINQNSGTTKSLNAVSFSDTEFGTVVGVDGIILRTKDGGNTWKLESVNTSAAFNGVSFIDESNGVVVGNGGTIFRLSDNSIPVELSGFTAENTGNKVLIEWSTATETNNQGFEIEKKYISNSKSEIRNPNWVKIGFVAGHGTTTETQVYSFNDEYLQPGNYQYRLKQIDYDGSYKYSDEIEVEIVYAPDKFALFQNYPNPFNPATIINYDLPVQSHVSLKVFNSLGEEVAILVNEDVSAGRHQVRWDASNLSNGMYVYRINADEFVETKKMLLIK